MASTNMGPNEGAPSGTEPGNGSHRRERRAERIGLILVIVGALALLSDLGIFRGAGNLIGMLIFAVLGGFALSHYLSKRRIGSLVGAFVLFGLAAATISGGAAGFYFLALIGVGFAAVYYLDRSRWWAIIPAGTLFSLAIIAGLDSWAPGYDAGWVLFAGLAATFGVLYRLPDDPKSWAVFPAVASLVLAVLGLSFGGGWLVPLILVAVGVYMLLRQNGREREPRAVAGGAQGGSAPAGSAAAGGEVQAGEVQARGDAAASGPLEGGSPSEEPGAEEGDERS